MKKNTLGVLFAALILGTPLSAAADPSYNYLELGLTNGSYEWAEPCTGDFATTYMSGVALRGSFAIGDSFFVDGSYDGNKINVPDFTTCAAFVDLDSTDYTVAFGWHGAAWYIKGGLESYDYFGLADDSGYMIDGGYRAALSDAIEWNAHLGYSDIGDLATALRYGAGFNMLLGDSWGVAFNYDFINWELGGGFSEASTAVIIKARLVW